MKRKIGTVLGFLLFAATAGLAQDAATLQNEPYPVELRVGDVFKVCKSGQLLCPAVEPICDDLKVVAPVDTPDGLGFKGIAPGSTLCSAGTTAGLRRVFRITVR